MSWQQIAYLEAVIIFQPLLVLEAMYLLNIVLFLIIGTTLEIRQLLQYPR